MDLFILRWKTAEPSVMENEFLSLQFFVRKDSRCETVDVFLIKWKGILSH